MTGLYIHIPFCRSKCAYCDFFSTPRTEEQGPYVAALVKELAMRKKELKERIETVYLGGGTPSLLPFSELSRLIEGVAKEVDLSDVKEFTIEANPEDITGESLAAMRSLGINRVSIGVQSFNDEALARINRRHSSRESERALTVLAESGINFSGDLIYGLPGQSAEDWRIEVEKMLRFAPPHLSAYLLSYEPGTPLYARLQKGTVEEATEEEAQLMYEILCGAAAENGYRHYEVSNFAKPGKESRHNSSYWNYTPYLGLGCAAHSFDGETRRFNPLNVKKYIQTIESGSPAFETEEENADNSYNDYVVTSLRTDEGLSPTLIGELWGKERKQWTLETASDLLRNGRLKASGNGNLVIPEKHWLMSDAIMRELIYV